MTITFQDDKTTVAADKTIELIKTMRQFLVSVVHARGKWAKIAKQNVMNVKDHCDLSIRYYTRFRNGDHQRVPANNSDTNLKYATVPVFCFASCGTQMDPSMCKRIIQVHGTSISYRR
jgi:hypothetical protein